jgi:predicted flap endonuclease-1-like 5' DNA nuclease
MTYRIDEIEGIGPAYREKLVQLGVRTTDALLAMCCDKKGRKSAAEKIGLSEKQLLKWVNMADLLRVPGVGEEYSELLEAAGVDTVKELRTRNARTLAQVMRDVNEMRRLVRVVPSQKTVTKWIDTAKALAPTVTH